MNPAPRREVPQNILDKIANAKPSSTRHPNVKDGYYLFEIVRLLSEDGRKGHCFKIEMAIVASRATDDPDRPGILPNPPRSMVSIVVNYNNESAPGNVTRFIAGLFGVDPSAMPVTDEKTGDFVRWMTAEERTAEIKATYADLVSPNQPGRGMLVRGASYWYPIQNGPNAGKPFVGLNWTHVAGQSEATTALRRRMIDSGVVGSPLCDAELAAGLSPVV